MDKGKYCVICNTQYAPEMRFCRNDGAELVMVDESEANEAEETPPIQPEKPQPRDFNQPHREIAALSSQPGFNIPINDFLSFRLMISGLLMKAAYLLGAGGITLASIVAMVAFNSFIAGLILLVLGNVIWRVTCEGMILLGNIHDLLVSIEKQGKAKGAG